MSERYKDVSCRDVSNRHDFFDCTKMHGLDSVSCRTKWNLGLTVRLQY